VWDEEVATEIVGLLFVGAPVFRMFEYDVAELVATRKACTIMVGASVIEDDLGEHEVGTTERERVLGCRYGELANMRRQVRVGNELDIESGRHSAHAHWIVGEPIVLENPH
jgi:hypothetical protein